MASKAIIIIFMLVILFALGSGLYFLICDQDKTSRTVKALSWRIGISLFLFLLLIIGYFTGLITPHGL